MKNNFADYIFRFYFCLVYVFVCVSLCCEERVFFVYVCYSVGLGKVCTAAELKCDHIADFKLCCITLLYVYHAVCGYFRFH